MAYNLKYYSYFTTKNGSTGRVEIYGNGFIGTAQPMTLDGQAPVIITSSEKNKFDILRPTGAFINVFQPKEKAFEYMNLFNGNDREHKVIIYTNTNEVRLVGYIMPELFSQPLTKADTVVQIPVADGLGFLESIKMKDLVNGTGFSGLTMQNQVTLDGHYYKVKDVVYSIFKELSQSPLLTYHSTLKRRDFSDGNLEQKDLFETYLDKDVFINLTAKEFLEKFFINHRVYQGVLGNNSTNDCVWWIDRYKDLRRTGRNVIQYDGVNTTTSIITINPIELSYQAGTGTLYRSSGIREINLQTDLQKLNNLIDFESITNKIPYTDRPSTTGTFTPKPDWGTTAIFNQINIVNDNGQYLLTTNGTLNPLYIDIGINFPVRDIIYFDNTKEDIIRIEIEYELTANFFNTFNATRPQVECQVLILDRTASLGGERFIYYNTDGADRWKHASNLPYPMYPLNQNFTYNREFYTIDYDKAINSNEKNYIIRRTIEINLFELSAANGGFYNSGDVLKWQIMLPVLQHTDNINDWSDGFLSLYYINNVNVQYLHDHEITDEYQVINSNIDKRSNDYETLIHSKISNEYVNNHYYIFNNSKKVLQTDWTDDYSLYRNYEDVILNDIASYSNESKIKLTLLLAGSKNGANVVPYIATSQFTQGNRIIENDILGEPVDYSIDGYNYNLKTNRAEFTLNEINEVLPACTIRIEVSVLSSSSIRVDALGIAAVPEFSINGVDWFDGNIANFNARVFSGLTESGTAYVREKTRIGCIASQAFSLKSACTIKIDSVSTSPVVGASGNATINISGFKSVPEYSVNNVDWQTSNEFSLGVGEYTAYARESGDIGCVSTFPFTMTAEQNPIEITSLNITHKTTSAPNGSVQIIADLSASLVEFALFDGVGLTAWQDSDTFTGLSGGNYTAYAREKADTTNVDTQSFTIQDNYVPAVTNVHWIAPASSGDITIQGYYYTENGSTWTQFIGNRNNTFSTNKVIGIRVIFDAGNTSGGGVEVRIGTTNGGVDIASSGNGGYDQQGLEAQITHSMTVGQYSDIYLTAIVT